MYSSVKYQHDDVIKWKHFPRNWPFVRGIHRSPVNSPHKGQPRGALVFSLICVWIKGWINTREAGDLRRYYDVIVMMCCSKGVDEGTTVKLERFRIRATHIIEVIRINEMNTSAINFTKHFSVLKLIWEIYFHIQFCTNLTLRPDSIGGYHSITI